MSESLLLPGLRRVLALAAVAALTAAGIVVPAGAAQAATGCAVDYQASSWVEDPGSGGFSVSTTITNSGEPITDWTLEFTLPTGQSFQQGWSANWPASQTTGAITATSMPWNGALDTGDSAQIGFLGRWSGSYRDPTSFQINGVPCGDGAPENQPPTVTLTSPASGEFFTLPGTLPLAATASDPDGGVDRVEFYVDDQLVGTVTEAPYVLQVSTISLGAGSRTAFARAVDDGDPPLSTDSDPVSFSIVSVPPVTITPDPASLDLVEGTSGPVTFRLDAPTTIEVEVVVTGDPAVSVSPALFTFTADHQEQEVTLSAAPGSAGAVATVIAQATVDPATVPGVLDVTVIAEGDRVDNPYVGAQVYVDPDWADQALAQAGQTPGRLGQQLAAVADNPTAVWLDRIAALTDGRGLAGHLDEALVQQAASGQPVVVQLVLYNAPGRDCAGRAAPGELTFSEADQQRYQTEFIDPIVDIISHPQYADLRIVAVVEPGALPSVLMFGAQTGHLECQQARATAAYVESVRYALGALSAVPQVYPYLEASFSGFFGYPDHFLPATELYWSVVAGPGGPGLSSVTGFVTNVGQYAPLTEPFLPDPNLVVGGFPLWESNFLDFNREIHELNFAQRLRTAFIAAGFPADIGMVIDTGRNGWGGPDRPTQVSTANEVNAYVDESRIDRRPDRFTWCNQVGAGIGARPQPAPAAGIDAYAWVQPPGISDGVADAAATPDPDRPHLQHRTACDPEWNPSTGSFTFTNALPGGPHAGRWFPELFTQLVSNAHPPVPVS